MSEQPQAAAATHAMHVIVVTPECALFDGPATSLVAPAFDGLVGVLPRHAPFLSLLGTGRLVLRTSEGESRFQVSGGFIQVVENVVRVVAEKAEPATA
jgi:F-type H+-transporting ATPase subunit epsilon